MTSIGPEVLDELQRSGDTQWEWVVPQKWMRRLSNDAPLRTRGPAAALLRAPVQRVGAHSSLQLQFLASSPRGRAQIIKAVVVKLQVVEARSFACHSWCGRSRRIVVIASKVDGS